MTGLVEKIRDLRPENGKLGPIFVVRNFRALENFLSLDDPFPQYVLLDGRSGEKQLFSTLTMLDTQFDKTTDTTFGTVMSHDLGVGSYRFIADLYCTLSASGGGKWAISTSGTVSSVKVEFIVVNNTVSTLPITELHTSLSAITANVVGPTDVYARIVGGVVMSAAGALRVAFAQAVSNGTSSVLTESTWGIEEVG